MLRRETFNVITANEFIRYCSLTKKITNFQCKSVKIALFEPESGKFMQKSIAQM